MKGRQGPVLCGRCHKIIGMNDQSCPWCGAGRPGRFSGFLQGGIDADWMLKCILGANVLYYVLSLLISARGSASFNPFGMLSPDQQSLFLLGATGTIPIDRFGRFSSLLAANYLHGGILHLLFNLMAFRQLAPWVSHEYGSYRMFTIYTVGGVIGFFVSYLAGVPFTIGASASVCALIGSLLYYGKSRGGTYGSAVYSEVTGWVISLFVFGLLFPGINNWGHGGGIVGGILLGMLLGYEEQGVERSGHRVMALVCGVATLLALGWGVMQAVVFGIQI